MLSVVMPAHNEAGYLETAVTDVVEGMRARGHELEILVVENGSTDDTLAIARRLADELPAIRVFTRAVADYGAALRDGILAARGEFISTCRFLEPTWNTFPAVWRCSGGAKKLWTTI